MMLDKRSIDMLLRLDDAHLTLIIKKLAADAGIPPDTIKLGAGELAGIRSALSMATDGDISRAAELIESFKKGKTT
ncbi:MAG: hypothetical protein IJC64_03305 [Clostridia bacterium]|nr:hypothetical protein [Clostridia bacterium]